MYFLGFAAPYVTSILTVILGLIGLQKIKERNIRNLSRFIVVLVGLFGFIRQVQVDREQPFKTQLYGLAQELYDLADKHPCPNCNVDTQQDIDRLQACIQKIQAEYLTFYDDRVRKANDRLKAEGHPNRELEDRIGLQPQNNETIRYMASQLVQSAKSMKD